MKITWNSQAVIAQAMGGAALTLEKICSRGAAIARNNMFSLGHPSEAGEYPGVVTSRLRDAITYQIEGTEGRIGVFEGGEGYAQWLETGTNKMLPRPWLSLTAAELEGEFGIRFDNASFITEQMR
jgi:hypothetical protein